MDLDRYLEGLRSQLAAAAETGDPDARAIAERLSFSLDAAARLMVLEVLSDAASEITRQIAPGSIDVLLRGGEPQLMVTLPTAPTYAEAGARSEPSPAPAIDEDDTVTSRTTLRLPDRLKTRVEQAAAEEGVSVNTWFVRAIAAALEPKSRRPTRREVREGDSFTGWAR